MTGLVDPPDYGKAEPKVPELTSTGKSREEMIWHFKYKIVLAIGWFTLGVVICLAPNGVWR